MYKNNSNDYKVVKKANQYNKNRCFLVPNVKNYLPLGKITVTKLYKHKYNPKVIIVCSKNGVRKNTKGIWGNNEVISIKKRIPNDFYEQTRADLTHYENSSESDKIAELERTKADLLKEKQDLVMEIFPWYNALRREYPNQAFYYNSYERFLGPHILA